MIIKSVKINNLFFRKDFTYEILANGLKSHASIMARDVLEIIYKDEIDILKQTKLFSINDEDKITEKIGEFLYQQIQDDVSFSEKTLKALLSANILPILILDNVDQLPLDIQVEIFICASLLAKKLRLKNTNFASNCPYWY